MRRIMLDCLLLLLLVLIFPLKHGFAGGYEQELLALINDYRAGNGLKPLKETPEFALLALEHSSSMEQVELLSHDGFKDRFRRAKASACVENVGWNYQIPQAQFNGWKKSVGHNKNMLASGVTRAGLGKSGAYVTFFACK